MNYATFKAKVKSLVFAIGEPENTIAFHDQYIIEALIDIQQLVPQYRSRNTDILAFADTKWNCGLTVGGAPDGIIQRVYTVGPSFCCQVNYKRATRAKLRSMEAFASLDVATPVAPTQSAGAPVSPIGDLVPNSSSNSTQGRATTGYWAVEGCRLYVFPYLQSNEDLVIEWQGIKTEYADNDLVYDPQALAAVRAALLRDIARYLEGNDADAARYEAAYREEVSSLYHWQRLRTESSYAEEDSLPVVTNGCVLTENINDPTGAAADATETTDGETVFAILGEFGNDAPGSLAVAAMINDWNPTYLVTTGGNDLYSEPSFISYDRAVGKKFARYIYPYLGVYGAGATDYNHFWPSISPTDRTSSLMLASYKKFFRNVIPTANSMLYYDRIEGPVHLFFIDSDSTTPDGNTVTSAQAEWLRVKLAASTSPFKIVVMCHPAYSSDTAYANLRWTYKEWGATLIVNGKSRVYERVVQSGLPYITNGLGGVALGTFSTITPGSLVRYVANYGAIKATVTCSQLKLEFITIDGVVQDTVTIDHA